MLSFTDPAITPAEATAYLQAGGATGWPDGPVERERAIIRGQRFIAARYNARWLTEWENAAAPEQVQYAIAEAALLEAVTPNSLRVVSNPATDKVLVQAGKLAWERAKGANGAYGWWPRVSIIEGLLAGLIGPDAGATPFLERA